MPWNVCFPPTPCVCGPRWDGFIWPGPKLSKKWPTITENGTHSLRDQHQRGPLTHRWTGSVQTKHGVPFDHVLSIFPPLIGFCWPVYFWSNKTNKQKRPCVVLDGPNCDSEGTFSLSNTHIFGGFHPLSCLVLSVLCSTYTYVHACLHCNTSAGHFVIPKDSQGEPRRHPWLHLSYLAYTPLSPSLSLPAVARTSWYPYQVPS